VGVVGLGYMGLVTGLAFAAYGNRVTGYDIRQDVGASISRGTTPHKERGLSGLLSAQLRSGRFSVVNDVESLVRSSEGIFLCLPTPALASGAIDLRPIREGSRELGRALRSVDGYRIVVVKSTVVPSTTETVVEPILRRESGKDFDELEVAANPEFLAEGTMVHDAMHPDRVVIGTRDHRARLWLKKLYQPFGCVVHVLPPSGAELAKYSSNAFLALKISFANEMSRVAEAVGIDIDPVMESVGADPRIGSRFLSAGPGFGGSCLEKDLRALMTRAHELGLPLRIGEAALTVNEEQTKHVIRLVKSAVKKLAGATVAVLGVAFKAGTDDVRESRAFPIVRALTRDGATVRVHDPLALANFRKEWERLEFPASGPLRFCRSVREAVTDVDLVIVQADWPEYRRWKLDWTRRMRRPVLLDLRRSVQPRASIHSGLKVIQLGVGTFASHSPRPNFVSRGDQATERP
jgi:UDPglucose 6-dehydrogenase